MSGTGGLLQHRQTSLVDSAELAASWNPISRWLPSHSGLFFEAPQRRPVADLLLGTV
jgi:hypothetical protein